MATVTVVMLTMWHCRQVLLAVSIPLTVSMSHLSNKLPILTYLPCIFLKKSKSGPVKARLNRTVQTGLWFRFRVFSRQWRIQKFWKGGRIQPAPPPSSFIANARNVLYAFYTGKGDSLKQISKANRGTVAPLNTPPLYPGFSAPGASSAPNYTRLYHISG